MAPVPDSRQQGNSSHASNVVNPADGDLDETAETTEDSIQGAEGQEDGLPEVTSVNDAEEQMFFASNKLAELKQMRQGANKRSERDSLDLAIHAQEQLMTELHAAHVELDAQADEKPTTDTDQVETPEKAKDAGTHQ